MSNKVPLKLAMRFVKPLRLISSIEIILFSIMEIQYKNKDNPIAITNILISKESGVKIRTVQRGVVMLCSRKILGKKRLSKKKNVPYEYFIIGLEEFLEREAG